MILVLAGGVGGARLSRGLTETLAPDQMAIAVNVGDDFEHLGLAISPDIDTVMYSLAGLVNPETGWGRADETWSFIQTLSTLGGETWFQLGDKDLAVHVERTRRLRAGDTLSVITADFCHSLGIEHPVMPVTDALLRTRVLTETADLAFQDYFVRQRCCPSVRGFRFAGAEVATPSAPLLKLLASDNLDGVIICPSNPWLSIAPILAVKGLREVVSSGRIPVVAVSPIVGGAAVKGPAAKIMSELDLPVSALGVIQHYGSLVGGWVLDEADAGLQREVEAKGCKVVVTDTLMSSLHKSKHVARLAIDLVRTLGGKWR